VNEVFDKTNFPLIIANADQVVDFSVCDFIKDAYDRDLDGSILTFIDIHRNPKWSFAKIDSNNLVIEVKEKVAISDFATVGIYYFKSGLEYIDSAIEMILNQDRVNGEFYTCPIYNYLIFKMTMLLIIIIKSIFLITRVYITSLL
jgi:dTDP-glucose pyrophosphorylase